MHRPVLVATLCFGARAAVAAEPDPFHWEAHPAAVVAGTTSALVLTLRVPEGYAVYRDRVAVTCGVLPDVGTGPAAIPVGVPRPDPAGGGARAQLVSDAPVTVPVTASAGAVAGLRQLECDVRHQGCRAGLCWPEVRAALAVPLAILPPPEPEPEP